MNSASILEETVVKLLRTAATTLPADVIDALKAARQAEEGAARVQIDTMLANLKAASDLAVPTCQDTGIPIFFVSGRCTPHLETAIRKGVQRATEEVPLRPNAVDPLTRVNSGDNTGPGMPPIHFEPTADDFVEITVLMKGAGSENMSALAMLNPAQGVEAVKQFVLDTVVRAGSKPCPPTIVGLGIGGTADQAALLSKRALLRRLDDVNGNRELAQLEDELRRALNMIGIGPMGLGGRTTVLGVKAEKANCHTASLPVAVSLQCWAARRASARVFPDGRVVFSTEGFE
jgi:fumarate hydratase subunit alpha